MQLSKQDEDILKAFDEQFENTVVENNGYAKAINSEIKSFISSALIAKEKEVIDRLRGEEMSDQELSEPKIPTEFR